MPPRVWSAKGKEKRTRLKQFCWPFLLSHARSQSFSRLSIPCRWHCTSLSWIKRVIRVVKYTKNFPRSVSVTFHDFLFAPRSLPFATIPKVFDQKKKKNKIVLSSLYHGCEVMLPTFPTFILWRNPISFCFYVFSREDENSREVSIRNVCSFVESNIDSI